LNAFLKVKIIISFINFTIGYGRGKRIKIIKIYINKKLVLEAEIKKIIYEDKRRHTENKSTGHNMYSMCQIH